MRKYLKLAALFGVVCVWSCLELNASFEEKGINNLDYLINKK